MSERLMWNVLNSFPSWDATSTALQAGDDSLTWRIEVHDDGWFYLLSSSPELLTTAGYSEKMDDLDFCPCDTLKDAKARCEMLERRIIADALTQGFQDGGEYES